MSYGYLYCATYTDLPKGILEIGYCDEEPFTEMFEYKDPDYKFWLVKKVLNPAEKENILRNQLVKYTQAIILIPSCKSKDGCYATAYISTLEQVRPYFDVIEGESQKML